MDWDFLKALLSLSNFSNFTPDLTLENLQYWILTAVHIPVIFLNAGQSVGLPAEIGIFDEDSVERNRRCFLSFASPQLAFWEVCLQDAPSAVPALVLNL
ncbi:hypothetical protein HPP92_007319 [Vanilla planifolia]|uniref:Uncharacterized protein n=1 Tax=Vanilla planifolia TaxID=51239 RepID=A0A835RK79_VANPL|nr:hypothetical protein HPP92_007524 [Vanilla planifolia]KAG0490456.1 hypothetical protein HPP92_007319 [Vanilla planifolia]